MGNIIRDKKKRGYNMENTEELAADMPCMAETDAGFAVKKTRTPACDKQIFGVRLSTLLFIACCAAFIGFLSENIQRLIVYRTLDSRHQLLPFLAAYGFGIFVLYAVFGVPAEMRFFGLKLLKKEGTVHRIVRAAVYFVSVFAVVLLGEMSVGLLFEALFGIKAWDLSQFPLAVTQYTSVTTSLLYATAITLLMQFVFPLAVKLFDKIPKKPAIVISSVLTALILADFLVMVVTPVFTGSFPEYWQIVFG